MRLGRRQRRSPASELWGSTEKPAQPPRVRSLEVFDHRPPAPEDGSRRAGRPSRRSGRKETAALLPGPAVPQPASERGPSTHSSQLRRGLFMPQTGPRREPGGRLPESRLD
jgi:hypothetical protein